MAVPFAFDHVFSARSPAAVIAAYFEPGHLAAQDAIAGLVERRVVEDQDDGAVRRCTWHVRHAKPLPFFVRAFVSGGRLALAETMTWYRAEDRVELLVVPEILGGRVKIAATYRLAQVGEGRVSRHYAGAITAELSLVGGKVEKSIYAEFEAGMPQMAKCTQDWLTAHPDGVA